MSSRPLIKRKSALTRSRLAIIFVLLTIAALFVLMGFGAAYVASTTVLVPEDDNPNIIHSAVPNDGTRPSDHNALESLEYAAERIYTSNYFRGETRGAVVADLGFMDYTQNVHNMRVVKGDYIFAEAISSASMKSVAEQKFFVGKDTILYRPSTEVYGDTASFAGDCSKMTLESFYAAYGVIPNEITKHVINTDVILAIRDDNAMSKSASNAAADEADNADAEDKIALEIPQKLVPDADGHYKFTLTLDPVESTKFYRNEVMTLAGANYIKFKSVELTFLIDENWYPISVTSNENYDLSIPAFSFLGTMSMASSLTEVFSDIDGDGEIPEYDFFSAHFDTTNVGGGNGDGTLGVSDYLGKAFGCYIDGTENLDLEADITVNGKPIGGTLKLSINVGTLNVKAKLGGLFIQYSDDKLYISNNNLKGYISIDKAKELLENETLASVLGSIDLDGMFDDGLIGSILSNCDMKTENGITTVHLPFSLAEGIDVDANLLINDDEMTLDSIIGTVKIKGTEIHIEAEPKTSKFPTVDQSYKDISGLLDFVPAALGTALGKTYGISGSIDAMGLSAGIDAYIDRTDGLKVEAVISALGQDITVKYIDGVLYAEIYNIKVKAAGEDIPELISAIADAAGLDLSVIDKIKPLLPQNIVGYLGLLDNIDVTDDTLSVGLNIIGIPATIDISRDGDKLSALKLDVDSDLFGMAIDAHADLAISAPEQREVSAVGNYIDLKDVVPLIPHVVKYVEADGINVDIAAVVDINETPVNVTGNVKLAYIKTDGKIDGVTANGTINAFGVDIKITVSDGVAYIAAGNIKLKLAFDGISDIVDAVKRIMSNFVAPTDGAEPDMTDILNSVTLDSVSGGTLTASANLLGAAITLSVSPESGDISLDCAIGDTAITANMAASPMSGAEQYTAPVDAADYVDIASIIAKAECFIRDGIDVAVNGVSVKVGETNIDVTGSIALDFLKDGNGIITGANVAGTLSVFGHTIDIKLVDGSVYAAVGNIKVKLALDDANSLVESVMRLVKALNVKMPELKLPDNIVTDILGAIKTFEETADRITLGAEYNGIAATLVLGDNAELTANASINGANIGLDLTVSPRNGTVGIVAPTDAERYIDLAALAVTVDKATEIATAKKLSVPLSVSTDGISISANVALDFTNGLALSLDGTTAPLSVKYIGGTAYITLGGVKLACDKAGLDALIAAASPILPDSIKTILDNDGTKINIADTVDKALGAVEQLTLIENTIVAKLNIFGITAKIELTTDLSCAVADVAINETAVHVELGAVTPTANEIEKPDGAFIPATELVPILDAALPLVDAEGYKFSLDGTVYGITVAGELTVALPVPATETEAAKPFGLSLVLDIGDVKGISVTVTDGTLYVVVPGTLSVSCGLTNGEIDSVIAEIASALPKSGSADGAMTAIKDGIAAIKSAGIFDIVGALSGSDLEDGFTLGADFNGLGVNLASTVKVAVDDVLKGINVSVDALEKQFALNITTAVDESGALKAATVGIGDEVSLTVSVESKAVQTVEGKENCTPITSYTQLVSPIMTLIDTNKAAKTISLGIDGTLIKTKTNEYMNIACKDLTVSLGESVSVHAVITLFSSTEAAQDVEVTYVNGMLYVKAGKIALSFDTVNDVKRIYGILEKYLPKYLADELKIMLGLGDGTSSLSEIGLLIDRIKSITAAPTAEGIISGLFTDLGALSGKSAALTVLDMLELSAVDGTPVLNATALGVTLKLTPQLAKVQSDETSDSPAAETLQIVGAEIATELLGMAIKIDVSDLVTYTTPATVTAPTDTAYVSIIDFVQAIDMAISTFTTVNPLEKDEITFDIPTFSFTYKTYQAQPATDGTQPAEGTAEPVITDVIKVTGRGESALKGKFTKHVDTDENGAKSSTFSVALEAHISLDMQSKASSTGVIDLDLYVIDRYPDSPVAYLGYVENGTGYGELVSIDFTSVMQILAAAMDIIDVDDATVEALVGKYRQPIDTTIFSSMDIMGLDGIKNMLNTLASGIQKAEVALGEVKAAVDIVNNAGSFDGLKESFGDIKNHIKTAIEQFATKNENNNKEPINGSAIDGSVFKHIVGGVAFGKDDANLWADVSNEITTGASGVAKVNVSNDGNAINGISISNLDVKTAHVDMDVKFSAGCEVTMSEAPTPSQYTAAKVDHSDLGNIKHLLFDVMNTANLGEFEIGGNGTSDKITLNLNLIKIINSSIDIGYSIKVKMFDKAERRAMGLTVTDDEPELKTAAFVELIYKDCVALGMQVVGDLNTRLYFFDNLIYIDGVRDWKEVERGNGFLGIGNKTFYECTREYRVYTLDDLSAMFADPTMKTFFNDFLFLLVPLSKSFSVAKINLQTTIVDEIKNGTNSDQPSTANPTIATVFKGYGYDGAKHTVTAGLKELTGSSSLSDITVSLTGKNDGDANILDNYITSAQIQTGEIGVSAANVKLNLTATLRNVLEIRDDGNGTPINPAVIRSSGLTETVIHDVYLNNDKNDVGKNIGYKNFTALLLGELPIAGSTTNPWQV